MPLLPPPSSANAMRDWVSQISTVKEPANEQNPDRELRVVVDTPWLIQKPPQDYSFNQLGWARTANYQNGQALLTVDIHAPVIRIGLLVLEQSACTETEDDGSSTFGRTPPLQGYEHSTIWRCTTATSLLRTISTDTNSSLIETDNTKDLLGTYPFGKNCISRRPSLLDVSRQFLNPIDKTGSSAIANVLTHHRIQNEIFRINTDNVEIISNVLDTTNQFDVVATLVDVDFSSFDELLRYCHCLTTSDLSGLSVEDFEQQLDAIFSRIKQFYCHSPALLQISTRVAISRAGRELRYGNSDLDRFTTVATSAVFRRYLEQLTSCYLTFSSIGNKEQILESVRCRFLHTIVLFLALLNSEDLEKIKDCIEEAFKITCDRMHLELLVLKIISIKSTDHTSFLRCLYYLMDIQMPLFTVERFNKAWYSLQRKLAQDGYVLPRWILPQDPPLFERFLLGQSRNGSWMVPWPEDYGICSSTCFRYLQHDGISRKGRSQLMDSLVFNSMRPFDLIPGSGNREYVIDVVDKFRCFVSGVDLCSIRMLSSGLYRLSSANGQPPVEILIQHKILNENLIDAVEQYEDLVLHLGSGHSFRAIDPPPLAVRVQVKMARGYDYHRICADFLRFDNRDCWVGDILKSMKSKVPELRDGLNSIMAAIRLKSTTPFRREWEKIDRLLTITEREITEIENFKQTGTHESPVSAVVWSQNYSHLAEWYPYTTELDDLRNQLLVRSKKLTISAIVSEPILQLIAAQPKIRLAVRPIVADLPDNNASGSPATICSGDAVLLMGHYAVHVRVVGGLDNKDIINEVLGYYEIMPRDYETDEDMVQYDLGETHLTRIIGNIPLWSNTHVGPEHSNLPDTETQKQDLGEKQSEQNVALIPTIVKSMNYALEILLWLVVLALWQPWLTGSRNMYGGTESSHISISTICLTLVQTLRIVKSLIAPTCRYVLELFSFDLHTTSLRMSLQNATQPLGMSNWIKRKVEKVFNGSVAWWPLCLEPSRCANDETRLSWCCSCGASFDISVSNYYAQLLPPHIDNIEELPASVPLLPTYHPPTTIIHPATPPPTYSVVNSISQGLPSNVVGLSSNMTRRALRPIGNFRNSEPDDYLHWCIKAQARSSRLVELGIKPLTDENLVPNLLSKYNSIVGRRKWFSLLSCIGIRFIKFRKLSRKTDIVAILKDELPRRDHPEYQYKYPDPPIPEEEFIRWLQAVIAVRIAYPRCPKTIELCNVLEHLPRKVNGRMTHLDGYGLHAVSAFCIWKALLALVMASIGPLIFMIRWLLGHQGDWQNALALLAVDFSLINILVILPSIVKLT